MFVDIVKRVHFKSRPQKLSIAALSLSLMVTVGSCSKIDTPKNDSSVTPTVQATFQETDGSGLANIPDKTVDQYVKLSFNFPEKSVTANVPRFIKPRNLSVAIEVVRSRILRQAAWDKASKVSVDSKVISSGGSATGVLVSGTSEVGGATKVVRGAIWYDAVNKQSYASPALISVSKWQEFLKEVENAAKVAKVPADKATRALGELAAPYGKGPAMGFSKKGDLIIIYSAGAISDKEVNLRIPAKKTEKLLSKYGVRAFGGARYPGPLLDNISDEPDPELNSNGTRGPITIGPDCTKVKCVAVTYDDGPGDRTKELLNLYLKEKEPVTFFLVGQRINESLKKKSSILKEEFAAGMEIGNHSMTHPTPFNRISGGRIDSEITANSKLIALQIGENPILFRPPGGAHSVPIDEVIRENGMSIINWDVDTEDWKYRNADRTFNTATTIAKYHAPIILMHDIHTSTVDAAPRIIKKLKELNYVLVTVSEQSLNFGGMQAGHSYCNGTMIKQDGYQCKG